MKFTFRTEFAILCLGVAAACSVRAAEHPDLSKIDVSKLPPAADKPGLTYDANIKPMLQESCQRCHGEERPKAGLRLDSLESILKGGKDGKVLVPGDSKASLLLIAAARIDDETAMPPKRRPGRGGPGGPGGFGGPGGPGGPNAPGNPQDRPAQPPGTGDGAGPRPNGPGGPGGRGGFGPPPKPLTTEQVSLLRAWIDQGAK